MITWTATLLFTAALARALGDSGYGVLFLAMSFVGLFTPIMDWGLETLITRDVAREPDLITRSLVHGLTIKLSLWVVCFAMIQVSSFALGYDDRTRAVVTIYSLAILATICSNLLGSIYAGLTWAGPAVLAGVLEKVLNASVGIFLLARGASVVDVAWVMLLGAVARLIWQAAVLWPRLRWHERLQWSLVRTYLGRAWPFVAYAFLATIYWKIDAVMLEHMTNASVVGWYGAAYRLFETMIFLPGIIAGWVAEPILSRLSRVSPESMKYVFEKELNLLLMTGLPICTGLIVLAGPIVEFVYGGSGFQASIPVLQVLALGLLLLYINSAVGPVLVSLDMERRTFVVAAATALLNVGLNALMIPLWQHVGAALATTASELAVCVGFFLLVPRHLLPHASLGVGLRAAAAAAAMALVVSFAASFAHVLVLVFVGAVVYGVLVLLLQVVPSEDWRLLRLALQRRSVELQVE
jgi:O-antigen/teichoic acid export membrane protein